MGNQMASGSRTCERELNHGQTGLERSQIRAGLMEGVSTQLETTPMRNTLAYSTHEEAGDYSELPVQPSQLNPSASYLGPVVVNCSVPQLPQGKLLIENSGCSRKLSISATTAFNVKQFPESSRTNLSCSDSAPQLGNPTAPGKMPLLTETQDKSTMTIKATYKQVKIRFELSLTSGIIDLRMEVTKRLKLEVGTFGIEYLDDDNEWILLTCDADLKECFKISKSQNCSVIKLMIRDIEEIAGARCENMGN